MTNKPIKGLIFSEKLLKEFQDSNLYFHTGIYRLQEGEDPQVKIDKEAEWKRNDELFGVKVDPEPINNYKRLSNKIKSSWYWITGLRIAHRDRIEDEEEW